jgi:hypothetical protein
MTGALAVLRPHGGAGLSRDREPLILCRRPLPTTPGGLQHSCFLTSPFSLPRQRLQSTFGGVYNLVCQ